MIEKSQVDKCWGKKGYTYMQPIKNKQIYINYLEPNFNVSNNNNVQSDIADYFSKTSQLFGVFKYDRIWGTSKNIERPIIKYKQHKEVLKMVEEEDATLEKTKTIDVYKGKVKLNTHKTMIFRRKKKK